MTRAKGRREVTEPDNVTDTSDDGPETVTHDLYNQHDGLHGRDPNVMYLDYAERVHAAESARALGFDVDDSDGYKNFITTGTPLVVKANLGDNLVSHPSTALLNARGEGITVDPVTSAEFAVGPDAGSPFLGSSAEDEDGSSVPVDDGSATTVGTGADVTSEVSAASVAPTSTVASTPGSSSTTFNS